MLRALSSILKPAQPVPVQYRKNFLHLYFDIGWFGVLNGSAISFLSVYAARLGANSAQIGLLSAVPSIISIFLALPFGSWLENRSINRSVFWTSIAQRFFYVIFAFFPLLLATMGKEVQVWLLIGCVILMSIPGTALGLGFNTLFASAGPAEWRGHLAGIRNAVFAITTVIMALVSGGILQKVPFPDGYIWIFGLGALGGFMSSLHLLFVKPIDIPDPINRLVDKPSRRKFQIPNPFSKIQWNLLQGAFGKTLMMLCFFHLSQYLPIPLFSVYSVQALNLSDQVISIGTAIFNLISFFGALQFSRISRKWGNKNVTGIGLILLGGYPVLLGLATDASLYIAASIIGGLAWSMAGGAMFNYLLETVPANNRPAHMAWYALSSNTVILLASMIGPLIGNWIGLSTALLVFGVIRGIAGYTIVRWG